MGEVRERVYVLAASREQAAIFAMEWAAVPGRAIADVKYLQRKADAQGLAPDADVVYLPGARHAHGFPAVYRYLQARGIHVRLRSELEVNQGAEAA
jgi:hypothetical protein